MGGKLSTFKQAQTTAHNDTWDFDIITVDAPTLREGDVLVKVKAAALNPVDNVLCSGMLKDMWPEADKLPFKPGFDFAGKIVQKGAAVKGFHKGQFVCGVQWGNGYRPLPPLDHHPYCHTVPCCTLLFVGFTQGVQSMRHTLVPASMT